MSPNPNKRAPETSTSHTDISTVIQDAQKHHASTLDLSGRGLSEIPEALYQLADLEDLNLSGNHLKTVSSMLSKLSRLTKLNLSNNQLTAVPNTLGQLARLQSLLLHDNQLTAVPDTLGQLAWLQSLSLYNNQLTAVPDTLGQLAWLQLLSLHDNQLTAVPDTLGQLARLQWLSLNNNRLGAVPNTLGNLVQLWQLHLHDNELTVLPDTLGRLARLQSLSLYNNQLTAVPDTLGQLARLRSLLLHDNQLTAVPDTLGQLARLQRLSLHNNQLTQLPESLKQCSSLTSLYIHGNDQLGVPPEVLGPTFDAASESNSYPALPSSILEYYFRAYKGRPLNEAKLILVGRGGVGKTSLVNRLVHNQFDKDQQRTDGIQITQWPIMLTTSKEVRLHIWDFGGQEIMHATHQFFLTQRSIYLLVLNGREGGEDADAEYWLKLIESFGGSSSVIIVLNKIKTYPFDLNRRALQLKYSSIKAFIETDCMDSTGIQELYMKIKQETDDLKDLQNKFPESWFEIKDQLTTMKANYLSFDQYRDFCVRHDETNSAAQEALAGYLHQLGIVLNYKDDPRLQDTHVLNPHWVTSGIYKILNSQKLARQKGQIYLNDVAGILDPGDYPPKMCRFIFDLMKKFDLCFSFPDDEFRYLIPELLDKQEPEEAALFQPETCLNFQYHYPILPEGLLPRFIVRTHHLSRHRPRWRTGTILEFEGNTALVKADVQDKKVLISVSGSLEGRRRLLTLIRIEFDSIHRAISHLQPQEVVPLPAYPEETIPYRDLLVMEENRGRTFSWVVNNAVIDLNVQELLNGVDLVNTRKRKSMMDGPSQPARVFYCYSHKDEQLRNILEIHLKLLHRQRLIESWHDREIEANEEWRDKIDKNLERADIILLLVSADFIASDYCYDKEMRRALERHEQGDARVIPIILRTVDWNKAPFGKLSALPRGGRAITSWLDIDAAWMNVARGIEQVIERRHQQDYEALFVMSVRLQNIRCFEDLELLFLSEEGVRKFILLFGDNGVGKTTLLRCLALGLCDETTATGLMELLPGSLLRDQTTEGLIQIQLADSMGKEHHTITTTIRRNESGLIEIEQNLPADFPRERVFACGYGSGRRGFGTQDYASYSLRQSLGTLFNYDVSLQNPELAFRRIEAEGIRSDYLTQRLDSVLMLEPGATSIDSSGIRIRGPWGDFMPVGSLGDGFQATLGWIADLFGWAFFHRADSLQDEISGIVLLDELEQHLHPSWQREILRLLHQQFPRIQFISTSHAPMCALGATALPETMTSIVKLRQLDESVKADQFSAPKHQRVDQVLTSPLFGLFSASGFDVASDLQRYTKLASNLRRSASEEHELLALEKHLEAILAPFQSDLERKVAAAVRAAMEQQMKESLASGELTSKALDFQIRYQVQQVLGQGTGE